MFSVLTDKGSPLNMAKAALCPGSNYKVHVGVFQYRWLICASSCGLICTANSFPPCPGGGARNPQKQQQSGKHAAPFRFV